MRFFLTVLCCCPFMLLAQAPLAVNWANHFGGNGYDQSTHQVWNGQYLYVVGYFSDSTQIQISNGAEDGFIAKYSSAGILLWSAKFGGLGADRINGIAVDSSGGVYIAGHFQDKVYFGTDSIVPFTVGEEDFFVAHYTPDGSPKWVKSVQSNGYESAQAIYLSQDNFLYLSGYYTGSLTIGTTTLNSKGNRDIFVAKLDTTGAIQWAESIGGPGPDEAARLVSDGQGNVYVSGVIRDAIFLDNDTIYSQGHYDPFLAKYNASGQYQWAKMMGSIIADYCKSVAWDGQDKLYLTGWFSKQGTFGSQQLTAVGEEDMFLTQLDTSGNILWTRQFGGIFDEKAYDLAIDNNQEIYLVGVLDSVFVIDKDTFNNRHLNRPTNILLLHLDANGQYEWGSSIGYVYNDFCFDIALGDSNAIYLTGNFSDSCYFDNILATAKGSYDVYVAKYTPTVQHIATQPLPSNDHLLNLAIYPNPFESTLNLSYHLPQKTTVQLTLLNLYGQVVYQQPKREYPAGQQLEKLQNLRLENGVYLLRFETKDSIFVQKIICVY